MALLVIAGALLGTSTRSASERSCAGWIPDDRLLHLTATVSQSGSAPGRSNGAARSGALRLHVDSIGSPGRLRPCDAELPARWDGAVTDGAAVRAHGRWWSPPGSRPGLGRPGALLLDTLWDETSTEADGIRSRQRPRAGGERVRDAGVARIEVVFPRHAALVSSLLLARRDGLDREVRDRYARAGLSHLLAISGLHVGLVAGLLLLITRSMRVGRRHASVIAAAGTVAYVALLGAPHSAARAALQIVLLLAARAFQRPTRSEALIAAAALVLLASDPGAIASPGFQLSFAGVAGILVLRPPMLRRLRGLARLRFAGRSAGRWLADGLATSVAATVATAPIVAWHFGRVAPVGVLANLLAIPLLSAAVPALALALLAGWIWLPLGRFVAGGGELLLDALDRTATVAAGVPFGTVAVLPITAAAVTGAVGVGYAASRRLGRVRPILRRLVWLTVAGTVLTLAPLRPTGDRVEIHLIDVGQGDAIGIRSPGGRWLVVDAGLALNDYDAGASRVVPYLAARGVRRIHAMIITHADADHMGGAPAVVRALRPRWAGGPGVVAGKGQYLALLREARAASSPWVAVRRGMQLDMDGMTVTVLYPGRTDVDVEDANDASVVLRLAYGEFSALLTGDAPASVEQDLVRRWGRSLDADLLKVGHHGSRTSTTAELLVATGARTALISAGRGNRYGHPHGDVLARLRRGGLQVYRTDRHGSVVVRAGADGIMRVLTERGSAVERRGSPE